MEVEQDGVEGAVVGLGWFRHAVHPIDSDARAENERSPDGVRPSMIARPVRPRGRAGTTLAR
ncbi:hypothetical protein GCM10010123_34770 [Pilimelia anulata]|uniref:Uncharacterized protein n=1 Tax=Pilimelia anulata TaxID=53371 RepID=A0A8J3B8F1_9ACTN|nr:hypothetical protein GCM10010123_34770 [Pilimelia anulata]